MVIIPELDLELASGTLGGLVTTVEGLLNQINDSMTFFPQVHCPHVTVSTSKK